LDRVAPLLEAGGFPYALVGGLGLHAYGNSRATFDLDLVTASEAQEALVRGLEELGYDTVHRSAGYSNHSHSDPEWGDVDVVYVDAETARQLFPDVPVEDVPGRTVEVTFDEKRVAMKVVGVLEDPLTYRALFETFDEGQGARTLTSSLLSFRNVYVGADVVTSDEVTGISVRLPSESAVEEARRRLVKLWPQDASRGWPGLTKGIGVFVRKDWMDALGGQTSQGAFLGNLVWIIIVGVAAIMISTLNLITMRERYDEVAVRRCEGARRRDVALQVTVEGTLTAVVGGLAGLPIGYFGAALLRDIVDFPFRFDPGYAAIATGIAAVLGLFSSVLPARHAARLQPARVLSRRLT
jgi:ABC-type antimicrobial peptide transport system permease subunit